MMELFFSEETEEWTLTFTGPPDENGFRTCRAVGGWKLRPGAFDDERDR